MGDKIYYIQQLSSGIYGMGIQPFTKDELLATIDKSNAAIRRFTSSDENRTMFGSKNVTSKDFISIDLSPVTNSLGQCQYRDKYGKDAVTTLKYDLLKLAAKNDTFKQIIERDNVRDPKSKMYLATYTDHANLMSIGAHICVDAVKCCVCNEYVVDSILIVHEIDCATKRANGDAIKDDYVLAYERRVMTLSAIYQLIGKCKIPHRIINPAAPTVYMPRWILDAIENFHKNGGFAGMEISEYLNKLLNDNKQNQ